MSLRKPSIRKPKIPKIKKPLISKRKRIKKISRLSVDKIKTKSKPKPHIHKKTHSKVSLGTCYIEKNCKGVLSRKISKTQCWKIGGKSWKKTGGSCEKL